MAKTSAASPGVILKAPHAKAVPVGARSTDRGWKAVGWFGVLLAVIGLTDVALYWYPFAFGSPEWEFGTVAAAFSALPLATIGLAAVVGALMVNRARVPMMVTAAALLVLALLIAASFALFLKNMPLALSAVEGPPATAMYRGIIRTTVKGLGFGSAYLFAGVMLLRNLPPRAHT